MYSGSRIWWFSMAARFASASVRSFSEISSGIVFYIYVVPSSLPDKFAASFCAIDWKREPPYVSSRSMSKLPDKPKSTPASAGAGFGSAYIS